MFDDEFSMPTSIFDIDESQAFKDRKLEEMPSFIAEKVKRKVQVDISIIKERDQNDSLSFLDVAGNLVNPTQVLIDSNEL